MNPEALRLIAKFIRTGQNDGTADRLDAIAAEHDTPAEPTQAATGYPDA